MIQPNADIFKKFPNLAQVEAECAVLGCAILDGQKVMPDIMLIIPGSEVFTHTKHAMVWKCLTDLFTGGKPIDVVSIVSWLTEKGWQTDVDPDYVVMLAESVPSATSAPYYAETVATAHRRFRALEAVAKAGMMIHSDATKTDDALSQMEQALLTIRESNTKDQPEFIGAVTEREVKRIEAGDVSSYVPYGFGQLDEMTGGMGPGDLIVVGARPSLGKTSFSMGIAEFIAWTGLTVLFFSLEMKRMALAQRYLSYNTGIAQHQLRKIDIAQNALPTIRAASTKMKDLPLIIDDTSRTPMQIRARAKQMSQRYPIGMIVVDYLQKLDSDVPNQNRSREVGILSNSLKSLAMDMNVPLMLLSQLNRANETRENKRPGLSDLRESGDIEQDADVVIFLHREDYYHRNEPGYIDKNTAELIVAKQRNGPPGMVNVFFGPPSYKFSDTPISASGFGQAFGRV